MSETEERIKVEALRRGRIVELADKTLSREGELEVDTGPGEISEGRDNGCYVKAWVWFSFADTEFDKDKEREDDEGA